MKICKDCGETKDLTEFVPKSSCKDGYEVRCRKCRALRYNKADPVCMFRKTYLTQLTHSIKRGHPPPSYSLEDFYEWLDKQPNIHQLWDDYVASNYAKDYKPSVDRINDHKPYTLDNIQLMSWKENRDKGARSKKEGNIATAQPVIAYHLDGTFYKEFATTAEAARHVSGRTWGIITVANGIPVKDGRGHIYNPKTYKGFKWAWK
ncbi:endonuclease VII [Shigella phage pSb-1]|uniref:Uncharacterized protein n=1 Tax=Shigella phage pSb-1 TaxID=1414738 RepID=V5URC1_9CAUD|nr:endonuclease VII [Shigella phage pSb-1]AHB79472.1 hypothetical protein psb1_0054 [Shigella phage pSb-1]